MVNHYIGFINCANSPSLSMLTMKIREEALEVPEPKPEKERRERDYGNYRRSAFGVDAAGIYGILGRYDYPVKKIKRNADRKQSAKTHQGYGVFWQADVFSREEP